MSIRFKIKSTINDQSKTQKKIGKYILENIYNIKNLTSTELAKNIGVGQSSIIKFINVIGFNKFSEFKMTLSEDLGKENIKEDVFFHNDISLDDDLDEATKKIAYSHIRSIEESVDHISFEVLDKAIEKLLNAKKIILLGIGASSLVAKDFQHKLEKIGKIALHDSDYHVQITQAICAKKEDIILAISHSGETNIIIETLKEIKKDGIPVISLTGKKNNSISKLSNINLYTKATENIFRISALSSRIAQLTLIDILFVGILKKDHVKPLEYIKRNKKIISRLNNKK